MYNNYGDVNFFENGILLKEEEENVYNIIYCQPDNDEENNYLFSDTNVDITGSWIDKNDVCKYAGLRSYSIDYIEEEKALFAIACISYYGAENFGRTSWKKKNEIIDYMVDYEEEIEDYSFFNNNFSENNRNLEIKIYYHSGNSHTYIYDTQDINLLEELYWLESGDSIEIVSK